MGIKENMINQLLDAELNGQKIMVDYHSMDGMIFRNEFVPCDIFVSDTTLEMLDFDRGEDWKCIIKTIHTISFDNEFNAYHIFTENGELIITL